MELIKEIHEEIQKPPPYIGYNEWAVFLDKTVHKHGFELVHIEDPTIGVRKKGVSDHVIVFPGADIKFGREVIRRLAKDNLKVIDGDIEYVVVKCNSKFPFVVSDKGSSWAECQDDTNPLLRYFGNEYPQEYQDKVFTGYVPDIHDLVKSIIDSLGGEL